VQHELFEWAEGHANRFASLYNPMLSYARQGINRERLNESSSCYPVVDEHARQRISAPPRGV
jgi:hypothetical protein